MMITEFELHAYIDGELAEEERNAVLEATSRSPALRARLNELRQLKEMVRTGYAEFDDCPECPHRSQFKVNR